MRFNSYFKSIVMSLFLFSVFGCSALSRAPQRDVRHVARAWLHQMAVLDVEQSFADHKNIYIKFRAFLQESDQTRVFYVTAPLNPAEKTSQSARTGHLSSPLQFISSFEFNKKTENVKPLPHFDERFWENFRDRLAHDLAPDQLNEAVQLTRNGKEVLLFYDADGRLRFVEPSHKPPEVTVVGHYSESDLATRIYALFRELAYQDNLHINRGLIVIAHENQDYPFFYINLKDSQMINLKLSGARDTAYRDNAVHRGIKSADYLFLDSHIFGIMSRPVSSTFRLLAWTTDAAYGLLNPQVVSLMEKKPAPPLNDGPGMDLAAWEEKLGLLTNTKTFNGHIDFLIGGDEFFPYLVKEIEAAQKSIEIRIFIFDNDDFGVKIADLLKKKAREGVQVKVLLDGMGVVMGEGKVPESLPRGFVPPPSMPQYLVQDSNIKLRVRPNAWFKADHIKTIVIDDKICFTGGMNIGREYRYEWHDMMMSLTGPVVAEIVHDFDIAWGHASAWGDLGYLASRLVNKKPTVKGDGYPLRLLFTRLNDPQIYRAQLAAIREAKDYIYINNSYFSDNVILYELIKARRRGVDVRVILPVNGNHAVMNANNVVVANAMFRNGIRVFFYPGMSHIKAAIYDGWLCTGTANFDKLSLRDNLEMNVATAHPEAVNILRKQLFEKDFKKSREMTEPLKANWKEYFASFLADQL